VTLKSEEEQVFIEVVKLSQTLDMNIMSFVVNDLLPFCGSIEDSDEKSLIQIVDNGCKTSLAGFNS
jgi:hypothetical protein